jgi:hypothetical protein
MDNNLRIITTARTLEAINKGAKEGYWPLVKPVIPSPDIKAKYAVIQNPLNGDIKVINDYRLENQTTGLDKVIDFTYYYPHQFKNPYAAYLIPADIKIGEHVWLSDLIEDVVGQIWNQGDSFRLPSCEAVWDGRDLILEVSSVTSETIIG